MSPQEKQSVAAKEYRSAKEAAHKLAKAAAKVAKEETYSRVYNELFEPIYLKYQRDMRQKGDSVLGNIVLPPNLEDILSNMEEVDEDELEPDGINYDGEYHIG